MHTGILLEFLNMGGGEIMVILVVVLLLFGGKKLPELARGLGRGIREFKDASDGVKREIHRNINAVDEDVEAANTSDGHHHPVTAENERVHNTSAVHDPTVVPPESHSSPDVVTIDKVEKTDTEQTK